MNFWKTYLMQFIGFGALALFFVIFSYYKFFKPDSENVIIVEGASGSYYVKLKEFNSPKDIQLVIVKILDRASNRQVLVSEGKFKFNDGCNQNYKTTEDLMKNISSYNEDENKLISSDKSCYLEKTLE